MDKDLRLTIFLRYKIDYGIDANVLDAYDGTKSLHGFIRALSLFTHVFLNKKKIKHAPRVSGGKIYLLPLEEGSVLQEFSIYLSDPLVTAILGGAIGGYGAKKLETIEALFLTSLKWVLKAATGTNTKEDEIRGSLVGTELEPFIEAIDHDTLHELPNSIESALIDFHRPFEHNIGKVSLEDAKQSKLAEFDRDTLGYLQTEKLLENKETIIGNVTRLNGINGNGRLYDKGLKRTVSFEPASREIFQRTGNTLSWSLHQFINHRPSELEFTVLRVVSENERTKKYFVYGIREI